GGAEPLPAFVDENTLLWALQRRVGDVIDYTDENGRSFGVRIAGVLRDSIFQGYLIVDEAAFLARFPSHPGPTGVLVDAPAAADLAAVQGRLRSAAADAGGRVETTRDLLAAFHRIENTYLAIFNVLGTLGVILGSLGLAIVVARNLRERRGEFAVLAAIGLPPEVLGRMVRAEFGWLVTRGVVLGAAASALATAPVLPDLPAGPTVALVVGLLGGILGLNYLSGWLVFRAALKDLRPGMGEG
ncbi:MAG: FtsX-like permease family protein, partial [Verrucomicrobiota bacterium]